MPDQYSLISCRSARRCAATLILLGLIGCGTSPPVNNEKLDPLTGVTVTFVEAPLVLYRENWAKAAYARNLVNMGPIQVNRTGSLRYYLWVGIWSTMRVAEISEHRNAFESILIFAGGEPLSLNVSGWTPDSIGLSEAAYLKPVASAVDAYYEVTVDQIRLIAEATDLRIQSSGVFPQEFQLWDQQKMARDDLNEFLRIAF